MNASSTEWSLPPENLTIDEGELHVWRAYLEVSTEDLEISKIYLSKEEIERANRFFFPKDRDQFVVSHAFLRDVLSRYLMIAPGKITFVYNSFGKPSLPNEDGELGLEFNLTHSNRFALLAVARGLRVGVDVELIRPDFGGLNIAQRFFSPEEFRSLSSLPEEQQSEGFFGCWTRKEAYIKAMGKGLSLPLDEFVVSILPGEPALLSCTEVKSEEVERWTLIQVDPAPHYSGTVAVDNRPRVVKFWDWIPETGTFSPTSNRASKRIPWFDLKR